MARAVNNHLKKATEKVPLVISHMWERAYGGPAMQEKIELTKTRIRKGFIPSRAHVKRDHR